LFSLVLGAKDTKEEIAKMKEEWAVAHPEEPFPEITPWDSNQISPGTGAITQT
jgi:hypothetical protein